MRDISTFLLVLLGLATVPTSAQAVRTDLPVVRIDTSARIKDDPKVRARVRVIDHAGPNTERSAPNVYDGFGGIELRGQSSQAHFPKKSYGIELRTRSGRNNSVGLLGMPSDDDWVLYAGYNDKTLMRNVVAYHAARLTGRWAARTRFVELVMNGRYRGVYVLMERPELSDDRIDISGKGLGGDYLVEFTFPYQAGRKGPFFRTPIMRRPIVYEDPAHRDLSARERRYVQRTVNGAERALYRGRRGGWRRVLDAPAAADYVLIQELFRNVDAFHGSTFMHKGAGARLALGPVWDFDLSSGNSVSTKSGLTVRWWTRGRDWAERLHADPGFRRAMRRRWRVLRDGGLRAELVRTIDRSARTLAAGPAQRNFRRWPILRKRVWQNPAARGSFRAEVRFLRRWLVRRVSWMDRALGYRRR